MATDSETPSCGERLQKVLAAAGIASRRECEELIRQGRVEVDGTAVTKLGIRVDPLCQRIRVDGTNLPRPRREYYLLNKPAGVVCTNNDPSGRIRVIDLIRSPERLFTVGRLDRTSEGLILVTNDGELSNRLTHPRYGVEKVYRARVAGHPSPEVLKRLRQGVHLAGGIARVSAVKVRRRVRNSSELEITLNEGCNREIRRILARVGHKVLNLRRIAMGPLRLGTLPAGAYRKLTLAEVQQLEHAANRGRGSARSSKKRGRRKSTRGSSGRTTSARAGGPKTSRPSTPSRRSARMLSAGSNASVSPGRNGKRQRGTLGKRRR